MVVYLYSGILYSHKNQLSAATDNNTDEFQNTGEIRILYVKLNEDDDKILMSYHRGISPWHGSVPCTARCLSFLASVHSMPVALSSHPTTTNSPPTPRDFQKPFWGAGVEALPMLRITRLEELEEPLSGQ